MYAACSQRSKFDAFRHSGSAHAAGHPAAPGRVPELQQFVSASTNNRRPSWVCRRSIRCDHRLFERNPSPLLNLNWLAG